MSSFESGTHVRVVCVSFICLCPTIYCGARWRDSDDHDDPLAGARHHLPLRKSANGLSHVTFLLVSTRGWGTWTRAAKLSLYVLFPHVASIFQCAGKSSVQRQSVECAHRVTRAWERLLLPSMCHTTLLKVHTYLSFHVISLVRA